MHKTAEENAKRFFETYVSQNNENVSFLEIGSYLSSFNIRSLAPTESNYVGVDLGTGPGVDIVLTDPYKLPFEDNTFDYVISSSCFEHSEFFWVLFLEIMRVLKPTGLFYLNAPSNGDFHRFPVDCWRFYPDSGNALSNWAKRNNYNSGVIEQYTSNNETDIWSDYVSIFIKDINTIEKYPNRITTNFNNYTNGSVFPHNSLLNKKLW
jgi:SAM-dependent methyltransferase